MQNQHDTTDDTEVCPIDPIYDMIDELSIPETRDRITKIVTNIDFDHPALKFLVERLRVSNSTLGDIGPISCILFSVMGPNYVQLGVLAEKKFENDQTKPPLAILKYLDTKFPEK